MRFKRAVKMPSAVAQLRQAAYSEVLGLADALAMTAYLVELSSSEAGAAYGLGFMPSDYLNLRTNMEPLIDKRYYYMADAYSEAEYPYPQTRLLLNGSVMENENSAEYAMHQGIFINLFLIAPPAFLSGLQERGYCQIQDKIRAMLKQAQREGEALDEAAWNRLLEKRSSLMFLEQGLSDRIKYYQIFPHRTEDYRLFRLAADELKKVDRAPHEDEKADWSVYAFEVPADLIESFNVEVDKDELEHRF